MIATKAYGIMKDNVVNAGGQSRYHLMHQLDASLKRLQLDHIDLYQLHGYDPLTPLDEVLDTLNDMVRSRQGALHRPVQHGGLADHEGPGHLRTSATWRVSKACRPTTPSPGATWSARSCRCCRTSSSA